MGKAALIAVIAFVVMGGFYSMSMQQSMLRADARLADQQREQLVRNAAIVGFEMAKRELTENFESPPATIQGSYEGATYDVAISVDANDIATVKSIGRMSGNGQSAGARITILSRIAREAHSVYADGISEKEPEHMKYAIITENDLQINGNVTVESDALSTEGNDGSRLNANIHTNGSMGANGAAASVRGFGTYVTSEDVQHESKIFDPYDNSTGQDHLSQVDAVPIPYADFDTQEIAGNYYSSGMLDEGENDFPGSTDAYGNVTLSGDYDFTAKGASREDPYIWHVDDGNLTVSGDVTMTGFVMFLVDGDVQFSGDVKSGGSSGASESHVAIYAMGADEDGILTGLFSDKTIDIGGNVDMLAGQLFCRGNLEFHGNPKIKGTVTVGGTATISGTPDIVYIPASPALTGHWQNPLITTYKFNLRSYRIFK